MKRRWAKGVRLGAVGLAVFLLTFAGITMGLFPTRLARLWIVSLNVPGQVTVSSVKLDPFMRLTVRNLIWRPTTNPAVHAVVLKQLILRPAWGQLIKGRRALSFVGDGGTGEVNGSVAWRGTTFLVTVTTPRPLALAGPLHFRKEFSLKGTGMLKTDLVVRTEGSRPNISGDLFFSFHQLHARWAGSPLGPLALSFVSGVVEGTVAQSVAEIRKIDFRGTDMTVTGKATLWLDPLTGKVRARATLYLRPGLSLPTSNPRLNDALKFLPRGQQGYKLSF